jgi:hypothetical protein
VNEISFRKQADIPQAEQAGWRWLRGAHSGQSTKLRVAQAEMCTSNNRLDARRARVCNRPCA